MNTQRTVTHLIGVALTMLWGGVLLYFYLSGRLAHYLPADGIFRPMVLIASISLLVLGAFNLATTGSDAAGCDEHDCGHDHDHDHDDGCCDHHHDHAHDGCCGHDHGKAATAPHDHAHGMLDESGPMGRTLVILLLSVPLLVAAMMTPDKFSSIAIANKGVYNQDYTNTAAVPTRVSSAAKPGEKGEPKAKSTPAPAAASVAAATPPATSSVPPNVAPLPPASTTPGTPAATAPAEPKSFGSFTLADLKAQVPQSSEGNFILEVPELYYTAGDKEVQSVLAGQPVETTAQVMAEKVNNPDGKRLRIFRLLVQCCAADARPFSVPIEFTEKAPSLKDQSWIKVVGTMSYKQESGQTVPVVMVSKVTETTAPENAMLY